MPALGLDRVYARQPGERAHGVRFLESANPRGRQRAASHLYEDPVQCGPVFRKRVNRLQRHGGSAVQHQPVLASLAGEGQGTLLDRLAKSPHARVAGLPGHARTGMNVGGVASELGHHPGIRIRRHEHEQTPPHGAGHHGRGQGRIAAAGHGQRSIAGRDAPTFLDGQPERHTEEVTRLVGAGHVSGLVLDPECALAKGAGQLRGLHERRDLEAAAIHLGHGPVQLVHHGPVVGLGQAVGERMVVRVQVRAVTEEWMRLRIPQRRAARIGARRIQHPAEHVVLAVTRVARACVARVGPGAAKRKRLVRRRLVPAARADQPRDGRRGRGRWAAGRSFAAGAVVVFVASFGTSGRSFADAAGPADVFVASFGVAFTAGAVVVFVASAGAVGCFGAAVLAPFLAATLGAVLAVCVALGARVTSFSVRAHPAPRFPG